MIIVRRRRALPAVLPLVKRMERKKGKEKRLPVGREPLAARDRGCCRRVQLVLAALFYQAGGN